MICPNCLQAIKDADALFCPKCGKRIERVETDSPAEFLSKAQAETDYAKKHEILLEAKKRFPNNAEVEKQLLFIGRLYEKGGKPDFYRIPYWPLSALERPGEFTHRQRSEMLNRFFNDTELERVAELSENREAFRRGYFEEMAASYIELFIKGANSNNSFWLFRRSEKSRLIRYASCVRNMLVNLRDCKDVSEEDRQLMEQAIQSACVKTLGISPDGPETNEAD